MNIDKSKYPTEENNIFFYQKEVWFSSEIKTPITGDACCFLTIR
jgi:hypothetical protein